MMGRRYRWAMRYGSVRPGMKYGYPLMSGIASAVQGINRYGCWKLLLATGSRTISGVMRMTINVDKRLPYESFFCADQFYLPDGGHWRTVVWLRYGCYLRRCRPDQIAICPRYDPGGVVCEQWPCRLYFGGADYGGIE